MSNKIRGSEKMLFTCDKNDKRSLADFENVEEALQACGGGNHPINLQGNIWGAPLIPKKLDIGFPNGFPWPIQNVMEQLHQQ
ncbi:MAG: hypothetical protein V3U87_01570 [Methylococcaceae bacterium]